MVCCVCAKESFDRCVIGVAVTPVVRRFRVGAQDCSIIYMIESVNLELKADPLCRKRIEYVE